MQGTKFQLKVWKYLKTIPKGKVKTYKQVAIGIKSPKSARAVANACAKNPYAPKIPCHRVIRSDGGLAGYSGRGGIRQKLKLYLEKALSGFQLFHDKEMKESALRMEERMRTYAKGCLDSIKK